VCDESDLTIAERKRELHQKSKELLEALDYKKKSAWIILPKPMTHLIS